jgi:predicted dehydrogenase
MADALARLGFLGVGWIGRSRMEAVSRAGAGRVAAIADTDPEAAQEAARAVGGAELYGDLEALLSVDLDGIVIATPTALHPRQVRRTLEAGLPVFCQKPLGRTAIECAELVALARRANIALGVDMSYRHLAAVQAALGALRSGRIGQPHLAELVFHNSYGPDKGWVRDAELAGGGALIDLGCHLIDLARLFLGDIDVCSVHSDLFAAGVRLKDDPSEVEDLALAQVTLSDGRVLRIACSWWLPAGSDAVIEATFVGEAGALTIRNVNGSFYDFEAVLIESRRQQTICVPPDDWGGRALISWASRIASDRSFDSDVEHVVAVAELIDRIYGRDARDPQTDRTTPQAGAIVE